MADDCIAFLGKDFVFPRRPENRAALSTLAYRIGGYPEFAEYLMRQINNAVELRTWTHRSADDPGIALLEGAAILGDILSFYQERYANEAFLRTAAWRESVSELVRLTGYRLAPGVGGLATFAFEVKGDAPVVIPAEFPLKADLEGADKPADFQTTAALNAYAHLSQLNLYRPRSYDAGIGAGILTLEIAATGGVSGPVAAAAAGLKKGDRLMLLPAEPAWTTSGTSLSPDQQAPQIVKIKAVRQNLDRTLLDLETPVARAWSAPPTAYRLGRSFRHFGHNAPATYTTTTKNASDKIDGAKESSTTFQRYLHKYTGVSGAHFFAPLMLWGNMLPLDQEVNDLVVGSKIIVQTQARDGAHGTPHALTVAKTIKDARAASLAFGAMTGACTMLTLDEVLVRQYFPNAQADVRDYQIHEVTSAPLLLSAPAYDAWNGAAFADGTDALCFYGTLAQTQSLPGRRLLLTHADGRLASLTCTSQADDFALATGEHEPRLWTLSFDRAPAPFTRADFDEAAPSVTVFGNLADATQGKAEAETALGNGDARAQFQTFKLPKKPLTYLLSTAATPPQVPELEVRVDGRLWSGVASLFGRGPLEQIYIVREDADGSSYVQFGDGKTGARLPSGVGNVKAAWRTGIGAHGPLKAGATPSAGSRVTGLDKVQLPGTVSGGADAESEDKARVAAPSKVQSLGRLVSLADFENEALSIPGVTTARAAWGLKDGIPTLSLTALMAAGREVEFANLRSTLQSWQHCRGPDRFPVTVEQAFLRYIWLDVLYAADPALARPDVEAALRAALGLAGVEADQSTGLFGLRRRRLGEREYASRIAATLQQVAGVIWCQVTALGMFAANDPAIPEDDDPNALALPDCPRPLSASLTPAANELLQLAPPHLTLTAAVEVAGECA